MTSIPMPTRDDLIREGKCRVCGRGFTEDDEIVGVVYAGDAWEDGSAEIKEGAHLYTFVAYHAACEPPHGTNLNDIPEPDLQ